MQYLDFAAANSPQAGHSTDVARVKAAQKERHNRPTNDAACNGSLQPGHTVSPALTSRSQTGQRKAMPKVLIPNLRDGFFALHFPN
jgi:hypothetical protein